MNDLGRPYKPVPPAPLPEKRRTALERAIAQAKSFGVHYPKTEKLGAP